MRLLEYMNLNANDKINYFLETLLLTNRTPEYFINWEKVEENTKEFEVELNILNYLIGKENIFEEARKIFEKYPETIKLIPILLAIRERKIDLLIVDEDKKNVRTLDFDNIDLNKIEEYLEFSQKSGLLNFLQNNIKRSLVDFVYGVETGIDTNGRKNRSGTIMENIIENEIIEICKKLNFESKSQATAKYILDNWGINVPVDKSERRFDEAVFDKKTGKLWLIETNFYGSSGSKLKAVAGEFTELSSFVSDNQNINFIWITDGFGWKSTHLPLTEALDKVPYIFNIHMLDEGYLFDLLSNNIK